ncbi:uncharacterized protein LOC135942868 [Cloeon dipterum]|uniref:uncharacterized protein LOC135942868 n=1 Tax=Cloeon dipterum TaxID=197152 RepID=UPI00321FCAA1
MFGQLTVPLFLLLLAKELQSTDGYVFPITKEGFVTACVSDETPVAFVKNYQSRNDDDTTVDVVDLNGNAIPLADHDCNLVREGGCEKWNLNGWEKQRNTRGSFPMVTDYRWNDFPVIFVNELYAENTIKITNNQNTKMYFSILAHEAAQFLFTSDSTLDSGCNAVIDAWQSEHKSVIRDCHKISGYLDTTTSNVWPSCGEVYQSIAGRAVLKEGKKWAHATLEITIDEDDTSNSLNIQENIYIKFSAHSSCIRGNRAGDFSVSFRSSKRRKGLFKRHDYSIIRPVEASNSMEVQLEEDSTSSFCVDVVFLTNERITSGNKIFSVEVVDATGSKIFDKTVQSADNYLKWTTERFGARDITPKKGWKIKLTAHDKSLVIGGVKFCKEGDLVTKTKMSYVTDCYPLVQRAENQTADKNDYNRLLYQLGECKVFGGNCEGYKSCHSQDNCTCFAGYRGDQCTCCPGRTFGKDCSETSSRFCFDEKFSNIDGTCLLGCVSGYRYPECLEAIAENPNKPFTKPQ